MVVDGSGLWGTDSGGVSRALGMALGDAGLADCARAAVVEGKYGLWVSGGLGDVE